MLFWSRNGHGEGAWNNWGGGASHGLGQAFKANKKPNRTFLNHTPPDEVIAWFTDVTQPDVDTLMKPRPTYIHLP